MENGLYRTYQLTIPVTNNEHDNRQRYQEESRRIERLCFDECRASEPNTAETTAFQYSEAA
jgi:hypothetical protein